MVQNIYIFKTIILHSVREEVCSGRLNLFNSNDMLLFAFNMKILTGSSGFRTLASLPYPVLARC